MKTNYFSALLLGVALAFTSCEQTNIDPLANDETEVIGFAAVATSLTSGVGGSYTESNANPTTATITPIANEKKGCKVTSLDASALPAAVSAYISSNYAGATIARAGKTNNGGTMVHLKLSDSTKIVALFDAAGTFVSAGTHEKHEGTAVAPESLPSSITTYISTNYAGATIKKAAQKTDGKYIVVIKKVDESITGLAFDAQGAFTTEVSLQGKFEKKADGHKGGKKRGKK